MRRIRAVSYNSPARQFHACKGRTHTLRYLKLACVDMGFPTFGADCSPPTQVPACHSKAVHIKLTRR